jgi:PIN domain nuclease of toxin-antitoxin system
MRVLLDTYVLLWFQSLDKRLSAGLRARIEDTGDPYYVSHVSLWEIATKHSIGKLPLDRDLATTFARVEEAGFIIFPLHASHIIEAGKLPLHHRDPFDRMLVAQAKHEGMHLPTADPHFKAYDVPLVDL